MDQEQILMITARQPAMGCTTFSLPIQELCGLGDFSRAALIAAVGRESLIRDWRITLDLPTDRVLYQRTSRSITAPIVTTPYVSASSRSVTLSAQIIDPIAVGNCAREYQDAELKAGRAVSATEAVSYVLSRRK